MSALSAPTPSHAAHYLKGAALVLLAGLMWSFTGLMLRSAPTADGWQYMAYRALGTVVAMLLWDRLRDGRPMLARLKGMGWLGVPSGALVTVSAMGFILAMHETTIANALFLTSTAPLFSMALGAILLREIPTRLGVVAIVIGMSGVLVMVQGAVADGALFGNLMALMSAVAFALQTICLRLGKGRDFSLLVLAHASLTLTVGLGVTLFLGHAPVSAWSDLLAGFINGFAFMSIGSTLYVLGSKHVHAATLAVLAQTEMIFGPIWVWLAFGERPSQATLLGGFVILVAILLMAWSGARASRMPHP